MPYKDYKLLVLMNFEVTSMDFQEPACCDDGRLYSLDWIVEWIAGLDFWTGFLDWILKKDVRLRSMQDCMCSEDLCLARSYGRS